jgi:ABC-type uncharacterized transport system permease subunit
MKTQHSWLPLLSPLLAIAAALVVGAGLIALTGANPVAAYLALWQESFTSYNGFGNTLTKMAPLLLAALGVFVAFRAGQFNLGGEGQIYLGGLGSALVGLYVHGLPAWIHIPLALLTGFGFAALWGWLPGYFKAMRGINEVITTLLLNYIALNLISYLVQNPLIEPGASSPYTPLIDPSARLPILLPNSLTHVGILIGLLASIVLGVLFRYTPFGFQVETVGRNPIAARYAGIPVQRIIILAMALAGGLAGLAGSCEVMGLKYRLFEAFSPGYGYDAVAIALLSRNNLAGVVLCSLFFGALRSGANVLQRTAGIPFTIVYAIQGLTVLFVAISLTVEQRILNQSQVSTDPLQPLEAGS